MSLVDEYRRQFAWREWPAIFAALPPLEGRTVLDLGCGPGDQAAELAARGARVVGIDVNEEFLHAARTRGIPGAEFRAGDLREPLAVGRPANGIWSSFAAAYFPDLTSTIGRWASALEPTGWIALVEVDDFFGHEPLSPRAREIFEGYAREGLAAGRYDFRMGRKLASSLERAGFRPAREFTVGDRELAFEGPAPEEILEAWARRLDRMKLLHEFSGDAYPSLREEFLACLARDDHRSTAKVYCCVAER
jgi:SAM-dependent methyltransferase